MVSSRRLRRLEQEKRQSTLQLLFKAARLVNEEATVRVNAAAGRPVFRGAIANLLPHITFEGIRPGAIAEKVGVSKQAVSKVVAEMVEQGVVEVIPDPADARGRLVRFTARGADAIQHGLGILAGVERDLAAAVGERKLRQLHDALVAVLEVLEEPAAAPD